MWLDWIRGAAWVLGLFCAAGCGRVDNPHPETGRREGLGFFNYRIRTPDTAPGEERHPVMGRVEASLPVERLRVFAPREHLPAPVLEGFRRMTGVTVERIEYEVGIGTARARMDAGVEADLLLIPGVLLQRLIDDDAVQPLVHGWIPNLGRLDSVYRTNVFDPGQTRSVPYLWSTAGIAYNYARLDFTPSSWADFFDPPSNQVPRLRGRVALLPDAALAIAPALIRLGYSPKSTDPDELEQARVLLRDRIGSLGLKWMAVPPGQELLEEEILMAESYAGDLAAAIRTDPRLLFAVPEDGTWERIEFLSIPAGLAAERLEAAHLLVNYLLDPKVAAEVSGASMQGSTVGGARTFLDAAVKLGSAYAKAPHPYYARFHREADQMRQRIWAELTNAVPDGTGRIPANR